MTAQNTIELELMSAPESVAVVRSELRDLGERSGLESGLVDDVITAVSEACNNVVLHAYRGEPGKLCVSAVVQDQLVDVRVSDCGAGVRESEPSEANDYYGGAASAKQHSLGLGVALIQALTQKVVFADNHGSGLAVRMSFARPVSTSGAHPDVAHNAGSSSRDGGMQRSEFARGRSRARAGARANADYGSSSLGWRTQAG